MPWKPNYVDTEELARFVRTTDNVDNVELANACAAASRAVDRATYRQFGLTASEDRFYSSKWSFKRGLWVIETDDFVSVTAVALDLAGDGTYSTTVNIADLIKLPVNAAAEGRPWERVALRNTTAALHTLAPDGVRLTGTWGWSAVPETIVTATKLQASRVFKRRNSPFGVAGSPDQGSEIRLLAKLDPDVMVAVQDFKRQVWLS